MAKKPVLAVLKLVTPDGSERRIEITASPFSIGRIEPNDLVLAQPNISRNHARLLCESGSVHLIDLNSSNGTFVNEDRLEPNQPHPLQIGDCFTVGVNTVCLESIPGPETAEEPETRAEISAEDPGLLDSEKPVIESPGEPPESRGAGPGTKQLAPATAGSPAGGGDIQGPGRPPPGEIPLDGDYRERFGIPSLRSRYLEYLPPLYGENSFLASFLLGFEGVLAPVEQMVDNFDLYLDPKTTPQFFLPALASWLDLSLDEKWPPEKQRLLLREAAGLYQRRGTRLALIRHLEIYTGYTPELIEPEKDSDPPHHFRVIMRIPRGERVDRATVERIIQANKPAHTTYDLDLVEQ